MKCLALASCVLLASPTLLTAQSTAPSVEEQIAEALLPLPDDLRSGAMVVAYDEHGNRTVLREGTNGIYCTPSDVPPPGLRVWCRPIHAMERVETVAKWLAEGKSTEEANSLLWEEIEAGRRPNHEYGTIYYRLTSRDGEQVFRFPVMFVPNATAESTGLSTVRNTEHPWLMSAGTPSAHVMFPRRPVEGSLK